MKKRKINWWNLGVVLSVTASLIILILTPYIHDLANLDRNARGFSSGYGGEMGLWLLPLTYLAIYSEFGGKKNAR